MKQGSSGLTLREFQAYHTPLIQLTPKKVSQWVQELPIANVGDSSKSIYRLLVDLNKSILDPEKRLQILHKIIPVTDKLISALERQFLSNHIALSEKQKKIAALVQALQTELSIGFHGVIEAIISDQVKWSNKKQLNNALFHALEYHSQVMLRCFQLYASVPARIWREFYLIYKIATEQQLQDQKQSDSNGWEASCKDYFIRTLLISIANPYQLRQREIRTLWELLATLTDKVELASHAYNKQHFIVDLESSNAPQHKTLQPQSVSNKLKMTVTGLVDYLRKHIGELDTSSKDNVTRAMLYRHLVQTWNHGTHRSFARTPSNEALNISIGLGATHYLLSQTPFAEADLDQDNNRLEAMEGSLKNATLDEVAQRKDQYTKHDYNYLSSSTAPGEDVWAKLYRTGQAPEEPQGKLAKNRSKDSIVKENYRLQLADLLNMSPGGYCVQLASQALPRHAQTGEVLGFLEQDNHGNNQWSVGVVRWVRRQIKGSVVQMGVQLLAPGALPVNVQLRNSKSERNDFQRALILPALSGIGQPATLVTNPLSFTANSKVRIIDHGMEYDARLGKEMAFSSSFRQFHFEKIGRNKDTKGNQKVPNSPDLEDRDFDEVWDLI